MDEFQRLLCWSIEWYWKHQERLSEAQSMDIWEDKVAMYISPPFIFLTSNMAAGRTNALLELKKTCDIFYCF